MSNPIEQITEWTHGLRKMLGEQVFGLGNRISSWLLLGNAGALVLLFNAKLGKGFIPADDAQLMATTFCAGMFLAFSGIVASMTTASFGFKLMSDTLGALHDMLIAQHHIDDLERDDV